LRPVPARRRRRGAGVPVGAPSSRSRPLGAAEPGEAGRQRPTPPARDAGGQGVFLLNSAPAPAGAISPMQWGKGTACGQGPDGALRSTWYLVLSIWKEKGKPPA